MRAQHGKPLTKVEDYLPVKRPSSSPCQRILWSCRILFTSLIPLAPTDLVYPEDHHLLPCDLPKPRASAFLSNSAPLPLSPLTYQHPISSPLPPIPLCSDNLDLQTLAVYITREYQISS